MNWKTRQRNWKTFLVMRGIKQKDFCLEHNINEINLSKWVTCSARANPENEELIESIFTKIKEKENE